jgi:hypothetical protein
MQELGVWIVIALILGGFVNHIIDSDTDDPIGQAMLAFFLIAAYVVCALVRIAWILIGAWF